MKIQLKEIRDDGKPLVFEEKEWYSKEEQDYMYGIVRDYLYEHQGDNAVQVSDATGVPRNAIMGFLRQGKISLVENGRNLLHACKLCGALIETGDICLECKMKKMNNIISPQTERKKNISGYSANNFNENKEVKYGQRIRKNK